MLYTRKGDSGTTKLYNCKGSDRINKSDYIFDVLGSLDELNSQIGFAKVLAKKEKIKLKLGNKKNNQLKSSENYFFYSKNYEELLEDIQNMIFTLQASFAGSDKKLKKDDILFLENIINGVEREIPKIDSFLISGHTEISAFLGILRANSRKTERIVLKLKDNKKYKVLDIHIVFLNRLSSFFYALERYVNFAKKKKEKKVKYRDTKV